MRNPAAAAGGYPRLSRGGERLFRRGDGGHRSAAGDALQGDARAHQGGRFLRPLARRPVRLCDALCRRRPASALRARAKRRRAASEGRSSSTATRSRRAAPISGSAASRIRPTTGCLAWSHDDAGSEFYTLSVRDLEDGPRPRRRHPRHRRLGRLVGRRAASLLCPARREPPPLARLPPRARHDARRTDVLVYEEPDPGFFVSVGKTQSEPLHPHPQPRPRDVGGALHPGRRAGGGADARRAARDRGRIQRRRGARTLLHPDQRRRAKDFQDRHRAGRVARPRELDRPRPARAGPAHPLARRDRAASRAAGARRRPAAHRRAPPRRRRRAHRSPSTRRPIRSGLPAATSSTPTRSASPIRRWRRRRASTTTTWRRARACCARSRRSPPATIRRST